MPEDLPKWLPNTDEDRELYIEFVDFMNRAMKRIKEVENEMISDYRSAFSRSVAEAVIQRSLSRSYKQVEL